MPTAYLAAEGLEPQLREELHRAGVAVTGEHGRLLIADGSAITAAWAANIWHDCVEWPVASIGTAAKGLRDIQRNWAMYAPLHHRRAALIQERLPHVSAKPIVFPAAAPTAPLGSWTLLAPDRLLAAAHCSAPFPNGEVEFIEDKTGPPNRAYLKLWEALVRLRRWPQPGERCLDLGASPGGWTWVLAKLGANVVADRQGAARSADRRDAGRRMARRERVRPRARERRPGRLAVLRHRLLSGPPAAAGRALAGVGLVKNFVCTIKFQGETDHDTAAAFAAMPGAQVLHLHHNKHELTFMLSSAPGTLRRWEC